MTQTITLDEPAFGYYETEDGIVISKFDLPAGEHHVDDAVANVVVMDNRGAWKQKGVTRSGGATGRDYAAEYTAASTTEEKLDILAARLGLR